MSDHPRLVSGRDRALRSAILTAAVILLAIVGVRSIDLPSLDNPFGTETVDRSAPPLLQALTDLSRFQAASGTYQVVVDVEKDVQRVPSVLAGERTLFLAQGTVDAFVDFSALSGDNVRVSPDGTRVDITLPAAALSDPRVDPEQSRVVSRQRGVLDRLGGVFSDDPTSERELYLAAGRQMTGAAQDGDLQQRAQENTTKMLTGLLGSLGYADVRVTYAAELRP